MFIEKVMFKIIIKNTHTKQLSQIKQQQNTMKNQYQNAQNRQKRWKL